MTDIRKQDWQKIITELNERRVTIYKIAAMMGKPYRTVQRWRDVVGTEPKHTDGQRLLAIYAEYCPCAVSITAAPIPDGIRVTVKSH